MRSTRELLRRTNRRNGEEKARERQEQPVAGGFQPICPMPAVTERREVLSVQEAQEQAVQRTVVPQPIRENSVYRQLMRSHDRVNTRHLKG